MGRPHLDVCNLNDGLKEAGREGEGLLLYVPILHSNLAGVGFSKRESDSEIKERP